MSPDARLLAATLFWEACEHPMSTVSDMDEHYINAALRRVTALETALAGLPKDDSERGIRGMIPVGLVRTWLEGLRGRVEAAQEFPTAYAPGREEALGEVLAYLGRCLAQLETL